MVDLINVNRGRWNYSGISGTGLYSLVSHEEGMSKKKIHSKWSREDQNDKVPIFLMPHCSILMANMNFCPIIFLRNLGLVNVWNQVWIFTPNLSTWQVCTLQQYLNLAKVNNAKINIMFQWSYLGFNKSCKFS